MTKSQSVPASHLIPVALAQATITGDGVFKYQTQLNIDQNIDFQGDFIVEIPTVYTVQALSTYYGYDAVSGDKKCR